MCPATGRHRGTTAESSMIADVSYLRTPNIQDVLARSRGLHAGADHWKVLEEFATDGTRFTVACGTEVDV
jgi:hypothetical protein